jgi:cell division protein FtsB
MMAAMRKGSPASSRSARGRAGRAAVATLGRPSLAMLLLVAGLLLASAFVAIEIQRNALGRQAAALQHDIAARQAEYAVLSAQVATMKTDDYVMNKAHEYGYVLPSEALIGVQQEATTPVVVVSAPAPSRVQKWFALFFGSR